MSSAVSMKSPAFLSLAFLLLMSTASAATNRCHPVDGKALLAIRTSVNVKYKVQDWIPGTYCCNWGGIQCNANGRVIFINLYPSTRVGTIPSAVGDLTYLQTFMIRHHPNLIGQIPDAIGRLSQLTWLQLDHNGLTGPIPASLFRLPSINYMDFTYNHLTGTIPDTLPANSPLQYLYLYNNLLTGTIPESLGKANIGTFYLSDNSLTSPLPASFANATFKLVDLANNRLTGDASMLFGANKPLTTLLLNRNKLSFDLTKVVYPLSLGNLDLSHNNIYGSISPQIAQVKFEGSTSFNVSYNKLCGQIPTGGTMGLFDQSAYIHNKCLCGSPLPACT